MAACLTVTPLFQQQLEALWWPDVFLSVVLEYTLKTGKRSCFVHTDPLDRQH